MSSCCVDVDGPAVLNETFRRACKEYKCDECDVVIKIGDEYRYIVGLWEGKWSRFKHCSQCADLFDSLAGVSCVMYGSLLNDYIDYLDYICAGDYVDGRLVYPNNHATRALGVNNE